MFISQKIIEENGERRKNDMFLDLKAGIWLANSKKMKIEEDDNKNRLKYEKSPIVRNKVIKNE